MPKRAIIRKTVRVKPGGKVVNRPNWPCLMVLLVGVPIAFLLGLAGLAAALGETPVMLGGLGAASGLYAAGELLSRGGPPNP